MTRSWSGRACLVFGLLAPTALPCDPRRFSQSSAPKIDLPVCRGTSHSKRLPDGNRGRADRIPGGLCQPGSEEACSLHRHVRCFPRPGAGVLPGRAKHRASARSPCALCVNNLKQIALALLNYESTSGAFPPRVIEDRLGRPLLSWRVAILPLLEGKRDLYDKFHLDEPWDSPHNRSLIDQMPSAYYCPGQADWTRNLTIYQVLDGPGVFLDATKPTRISEIGDGLGKTIAVVEGRIPVPWTSPQDVPFRPDQPFLPWEATHPGGFNATFVDGSVRFYDRTIPESELKAYATRSGAEK